MKATRRHWYREVGTILYFPLSMLASKHGSKGRGLSQFRVILFMFAVGFVSHWPVVWSADSVMALMALVFALPISDLFSKVPVGEAVGALEAFFTRRGGSPIPSSSSSVEADGHSGAGSPSLSEGQIL